jgi:hypothetical protein
LFCLSEQTSRGISGEVARQSRDRIASTLPDSRCPARIPHRQFRQTSLQSRGVELTDGKHADAA